MLRWLLLLLLCALPLAPAALAQTALIPSPPGNEAAQPAGAEDETSVAQALRLLAIVLDDPEARAILVEQLRAVEPQVPADRATAAPQQDAELEPTIPQIIVEETAGLVERVTTEAAGILGELLAVREIRELSRDFDFAAAWEIVAPVVFLIGVVAVALWLIRLVARLPLSRLEGSATAEESALAPFRWKLFGLLLETGRVVLAWGIGFATALLLGDGAITPEMGIFLTAVLWVELARMFTRIVFRPRHPGLRLIRMADATARHWAFWTARIVGVFGYGTLFLAPLADLIGAPRLAGWLMLASVLLAAVMSIILILRNRDPVRDALESRLKHLKADVIIRWLYPLAHYWHLIASAYILALFVVWRAVPGDAVGFMMRATAASIVVILLGSFLIALISRSIADGVRLDERVRRKFPLLEMRLNRFVPALLQILRILSAVIVLASILTFWGIIDAPGWLASPQGRRIAWSFLWIATILLLAAGLWLIVSSWVEYRLNPDVGTRPTPRERTLLALFSNAFFVILGIITAMTVLTEIGINIAPLLAGAGVVGLAIGFGAQKLVQDIINGAFIQFENTMNEGDVVTAGGITGVVEKLTIRSVSLRDLNGHYHMIPFSGVDMVTNFMKGFSFHVAEIDVAYRENISEVKAAMQEAFDRLMETEHRANILPPLEIQGIVAFLDSGITVRARIKTLPGQQWATGRAYSELIKEVFDERDIEIPFPHRTIYMGVGKDGTAPPLNLRRAGPRRGEGRQGEEARGVSGQPAPEDLAPPTAADTPPGPDEV
jgi:small-conductance mechanosensitive channel